MSKESSACLNPGKGVVRVYRPGNLMSTYQPRYKIFRQEMMHELIRSAHLSYLAEDVELRKQTETLVPICSMMEKCVGADIDVNADVCPDVKYSMCLDEDTQEVPRVGGMYVDGNIAGICVAMTVSTPEYLLRRCLGGCTTNFQETGVRF